MFVVSCQRKPGKNFTLLLNQLANLRKAKSKEAVLELWVKKYSGELYNYAVVRIHNKQDAEDLVQTTFLKAFRSYDSFKQGADERAWLYSILLNSIRDHARKKSRTPEKQDIGEEQSMDDYLVDKASNPEEKLLEKENLERLAQGIAALPENFSQPLILCDIQEKSYKEISGILNIPMGTVMSRIARARKSLMKLMQADDTDQINASKGKGDNK